MESGTLVFALRRNLNELDANAVLAILQVFTIRDDGCEHGRSRKRWKLGINMRANMNKMATNEAEAAARKILRGDFQDTIRRSRSPGFQDLDLYLDDPTLAGMPPRGAAGLNARLLVE